MVNLSINDLYSYENQVKLLFKNFNIRYSRDYLNNLIKYINNSELKALSNPLYINVYAEKTPYLKYPTFQDNLERLINKTKKYIKIYNRNEYNYDFIDTWSKIANKKPLYIFKDTRQYNFPQKRFITKKMDINEFLNKKMSDQYGYLLENYIIYSLNLKNFKCPECNSISSISLCIDTESSLDSFRDAVCCECYKKGIYTIFEIKTRNYNLIHKNLNNNSESIIYSGDYLSINTFLKIKYSVYIILYARDSGDVFLGKIIDKKIRPNERFLYSLQEGYESSCISSNILCNNVNYVTNIGISDNFLTVKDADDLTKKAINNVLNN